MCTRDIYVYILIYLFIRIKCSFITSEIIDVNHCLVNLGPHCESNSDSKASSICCRSVTAFKIMTMEFVLEQAQKKTYRSQKKEAAKELLSTITDPSVVLLGDWLKVRGTLKSWTKLWCVLKPGVLILYKSDKQKVSGSAFQQHLCSSLQVFPSIFTKFNTNSEAHVKTNFVITCYATFWAKQSFSTI